ncbi:MAG: hypothetical protein JWM20_338 [Patescibacteria group bacterium]|nr:hypothetical protein [Patescibacteria group bacterium]
MNKYPNGHWLGILTDIEIALPQLLRQRDSWNSVYVDYEEPVVERLWMQYGNYRISLHKIHVPTTKSALFHPHPWPSAMRIVNGVYRMDVGYGEGSVPPPVMATILLPAGSTYEMADPDGWHSVSPVSRATYTVMVTGKPWKRESPKSSNTLRTLTDAEREHLFEIFSSYYSE